MSDLDRDLRKQPVNVPILSTDGDTYTAPGEDWDGTETRAPLSSGEESLGFEPNTKITPETFNALLGVLGEGLASVLDAPAITWSQPAIAVGDAPAFEGLGNGLFAGPTVAPHQAVGMVGEVLCAVNSGGLHTSFDGRRWTAKSGLGFSAAASAMAAGKWNDGTDHDVVMVFSEESGANEFRYSVNLGTSFSDGGQLPSGADGSGAKMGFFGNSFLIATADGFVFTSDHFDDDDDWDLAATWSDPGDPVLTAANSTELLVALNDDPGVLIFDGSAVSSTNTGLPSGTSVVALAWSESHARWFLVTAAGDLYSSPRAASGVLVWTQLTTPTVESGPAHAIAAHGRVIVLSSGAFMYASRDLERWARLMPYPDQSGSLDYWEWIIPFNGALWAAHRSTKSTGSGVTFEHTMSGVLAPELARVFDW